jgi:hypothetical protein
MDRRANLLYPGTTAFPVTFIAIFCWICLGMRGVCDVMVALIPTFEGSNFRGRIFYSDGLEALIFGLGSSNSFQISSVCLGRDVC